MPLTIIIEHRDSLAHAREYARFREAQAKKVGHGTLPQIPGRGYELDQCQSCAADTWVRAGASGWGYCAECRPKQRKRARLGYE